MRERLARLRVPLGFAGALVVLALAAPTRTSLVFGCVVALMGEALRFWAAGHLNKSREVTASGPYRWLAHPLYVGSSVMAGGLAIAANNVVAAAIVATYLLSTYVAAIASEEAFLRRRFAGDYDDYRRTGRIDRERRFALRQVIANREYRAVAGLVLVVLLLILKATYNGLFWGQPGR